MYIYSIYLHKNIHVQKKVKEIRAMTREELKKLVEEKLGSTQLKLSERTINEELDDVLGDFGDNEETNTKLVERIANRLKRMDGNLHADVSKEVKEYKENAEKKLKEGNEGGSKKNEGNEGSESEIMKELKNLRTELDEERNARKKEQTERAKHALMDNVRKGLKDKFDNAGLKLNSFFAKSALAKLEIQDGDNDLNALIEKAEKLYNADVKEAGVDFGKPNSGLGGARGSDNQDKHEFDDIAELRKRDNPDVKD